MKHTHSSPLSWAGKLVGAAVAACLFALPLASSAQVTIAFNVGAAPPPLPYYTQPALQTPGQIWQPGYWAYGPAGYYWVPGSWVTPPAANMYWTPGYWGSNNGGYSWNNGYWGPQVGYYGGIDYGYGYNGNGYVGGRWNNGIFAYNTAVNAVNTAVVRHVYVNRYGVVTRVVTTRYSYNGPGGIRMAPTPAQLAIARERRFVATAEQTRLARIAAADRDFYWTVNHGHPAVGAVRRPYASVRDVPRFHAVTSADLARAREQSRDNAQAAWRAQHAAKNAAAAPHHATAAGAHANAAVHASSQHASTHASTRSHANANGNGTTDHKKKPPSAL